MLPSHCWGHEAADPVLKYVCGQPPGTHGSGGGGLGASREREGWEVDQEGGGHIIRVRSDVQRDYLFLAFLSRIFLVRMVNAELRLFGRRESSNRVCFCFPRRFSKRTRGAGCVWGPAVPPSEMQQAPPADRSLRQPIPTTVIAAATAMREGRPLPN